MNYAPDELKLDKFTKWNSFTEPVKWKIKSLKSLNRPFTEENKIVRIYRLLKKIILSIERKYSITTEGRSNLNHHIFLITVTEQLETQIPKLRYRRLFLRLSLTARGKQTIPSRCQAWYEITTSFSAALASKERRNLLRYWTDFSQEGAAYWRMLVGWKSN